MNGGSLDSNPQSTLEEEAKKSHTDCVYFLASPLTCIKGVDCEYRHSDTARVNPRDCWFWLNGNCLNSKCAFRHPPLDGYLGASGATSSGASHPQNSLPPAVPVPVAQYGVTAYTSPYTSSRQRVPCYYFQKGNCLKGDNCLFMHSPELMKDHALPTKNAKATTVSVAESLQKIVNESKNPSFKQKTPQASSVQTGTSHQIVKAHGSGPFPSIGNTSQKDDLAQDVDYELTLSTRTELPATGGSALNRLRLRSQAPDEPLQNVKDVEQCLGESPPGFNVLVTNGEEEEEYFETDMVETDPHGGMSLSSMREFDYMGSYIRDELEDEERELGACDAYERKQEQRRWEYYHAPQENLSERRGASSERRLLPRDESPDWHGVQDLRHQLSKRRRVNMSGVAGPNGCKDFNRGDDQLVEDWHHRHPHRKQFQRSGSESSLSKRLRGRVKFPDKRSSDVFSEPYSNLKSHPRRMRERSSPTISQGMRRHEKVTGRANEDPIFEGKGPRGQMARKEERKTDMDFAGPKSLTELMSAKASGTREQRQTSLSRSALKSRVVQEGEEAKSLCPRKCSNTPLSFAGPKTLGDILNGKGGVASGNGVVTDRVSIHRVEIKKDVNQSNHSLKEELDSEDKVHPFQSGGSPSEAGCIVQGGPSMLDPQDADAANVEGDRESDLGFDGEENEDDVDEEYLDDEDFARKLGVIMFT